MKTKTISVSKDFSPFPAGRYEADGPYTGEGFRNKLLVPALTTNDKVTIELDGSLGYGSSFLEEAFGGLIREEGFSEKEILEKVEFKCARKSVLNTIMKYLSSAQQNLNNK